MIKPTFVHKSCNATNFIAITMVGIVLLFLLGSVVLVQGEVSGSSLLRVLHGFGLSGSTGTSPIGRVLQHDSLLELRGGAKGEFVDQLHSHSNSQQLVA